MIKLKSFLLTFGLLLALLPSGHASAACQTTLPATSRSTHKLTIGTVGTYALWLRMYAPTNERNSVWLQMDNECPVLVGDSQSGAEPLWVGYHDGDVNKPMVVRLPVGQHTLTIAERETATGVDKILLTSNLLCTPVTAADTCPALATTTKSKTPGPVTKTTHNPWILGGVAVIILLTIGFLVWKYRRFVQQHHAVRQQSGVVVGEPGNEPLRWPALVVHFFNHHKLTVFVCGSVIVACLIVGVVVAQRASYYALEAETGTLSGNVAVVSDDKASGGKYVLLGQLPPPPAPKPTASKSKSTGSGGGSSGSGSGNNYAAVCPAFPAFPDENCTGWKHTGITLHNCDEQTDGGYIWDDAAVKSFDSCYFSKALTIEGANVTIKRSQVHGNISTHWSHSYDFRNLILEDVEIEDEGNAGAYLSAVGGHNFSCLRCNVHHTGTGIHLGNNAVIEDSYMHDFNYTDGAHGAGIGAGQGNGNGAQVIHNNVQCNRLPGQPTICSSAMSLYDEPTIDNVLVKNNLFNTTGGYCIYGGGEDGTNIRFIDNYFGKKFNPECAVYGPATAFYPNSPGNVWSGNKWQDGSGDVPYQ